jgi:hypothetical protein
MYGLSQLAIGAPAFGVPSAPWNFGSPAAGMEYHLGVVTSAATEDEYGSVQLWNPVGSGVTLYCFRAEVVGGANTGFLVGFSDTQDADETGTSYASRPGLAAASAELRSGTVADAPATNLGPPWRRLRVPAGAIPAIRTDAPVIIPEGWGLTLRNLTANQDISAHFSWGEVPAVITEPAPEYEPGAAGFDGSTTYIEANADGIFTDFTAFTWSIWFRHLGAGVFVNDYFVGTDQASDPNLALFLGYGGDNINYGVQVQGRNAAGTVTLNAASSFALYPTDQDWHHYAGSFDLTDTSKRWAMFDGEDLTSDPTWSYNFYNTLSNISLATYKLRISGASGMFTGELGPIMLSNAYVTPEVGATWISQGKPVKPVYPDWPIVFDNPLDTYHVNKGTLGDVFTLVGTLTQASTPIEL